MFGEFRHSSCQKIEITLNITFNRTFLVLFLLTFFSPMNSVFFFTVFKIYLIFLLINRGLEFASVDPVFPAMLD